MASAEGAEVPHFENVPENAAVRRFSGLSDSVQESAAVRRFSGLSGLSEFSVV